MKIQEDHIISMLQSGDDKVVIKHLYKKVFPKVKNSIRGKGGNEEDAADAFQEVIMHFYKMVITNQFDKKYKVYGFLYTMSINRWLNILRKKKKMDYVEDIENNIQYQDTTPELEIKPVQIDQNNLLQTFFQDLGERCLELLNYTIFQNISYEDIALRMEIPNTNAAKMQVFRCKQKLLQKVDENPVLKSKLQELI